MVAEKRVMLLDLGNSSLKWGWRGDGELCLGGQLLHRGGRLPALLDAAWDGMAAPDGIYGVNVAPDAVRRQLQHWVAERWRRQVTWFGATANAAGVVCGYRIAANLGADRWAAIVAAYRKYRSPVCVLDCGTAVTIDAVDAEGRHLGGFLLPGLGLARDCLLAHTGIARLEEEIDSGFWGDDTAAAFRLGIRHALVGLLDRLRREMRKVGEGEMILVYTGGDSRRVLGTDFASGYHHPDLVLEGVAVLLQEETG